MRRWPPPGLPLPAARGGRIERTAYTRSRRPLADASVAEGPGGIRRLRGVRCWRRATMSAAALAVASPPAQSIWHRVRDYVLPMAAISVIFVMLVPVPAAGLDFLLALSMAASIIGGGLPRDRGRQHHGGRARHGGSVERSAGDQRHEHHRPLRQRQHQRKPERGGGRSRGFPACLRLVLDLRRDHLQLERPQQLDGAHLHLYRQLEALHHHGDGVERSGWDQHRHHHHSTEADHRPRAGHHQHRSAQRRPEQSG